MDPYGRAKTVRIGKWRWPPARSDDDPAPTLTTGSFLEFKMQKNLNKKNNKVLFIFKVYLITFLI